VFQIYSILFESFILRLLYLSKMIFFFVQYYLLYLIDLKSIILLNFY